MDINYASREELMRAFRVDGRRADALIRRREQLGGFKSWEDLADEVPGYGAAMVDGLVRAGVTLGEDASSSRQTGSPGASTGWSSAPSGTTSRTYAHQPPVRRGREPFEK